MFVSPELFPVQIRLPEPVQFRPEVRPVCLPTKSEAGLALAGLPAVVLGWGLTRDQDQELSRTLQEAEVRTITNTACELEFPMVVTSTNLCISGQGGRSTCSGDSGGPLLLQSEAGIYKQVQTGPLDVRDSDVTEAISLMP